MSKQEKLKAKLLRSDSAFTWRELVTLLTLIGFQRIERAGSRVDFEYENSNLVIKLHKPHPQKEIKSYVAKQVRETLQNEGLL